MKNSVMTDIQARKTQHLQLALEEGSQGKRDLFADYLLPYKALPEIDFKSVDTSTGLLGKIINQPLIIASMTGGAVAGEKINGNLAIAAQECKVALGVGSQRAALEKPEMRKSFAIVRKNAPHTVIFANMGAVQLNYGRRTEDFRRVIEMISADALYLHINPMQEAIQPEGDTNFKFLIPKIEILIKKIGIPVFIKEVGSGIDPETAKKLINIGVSGIDIAGVGGTSWTWIEGKRANNSNLTEWFKDFGIPSDEILPKIARIKGKAKLIVSGGVRNPIQGLKAHLMGADYYSAARPFLVPAMESAEAVINLIRDWEKGLKIAMFGCGINKW